MTSEAILHFMRSLCLHTILESYLQLPLTLPLTKIVPQNVSQRYNKVKFHLNKNFHLCYVSIYVRQILKKQGIYEKAITLCDL